MTVFGMSSALVAGIISALSTYAVQSITNLDPVFRIVTAGSLRSSAWTRSPAQLEILDDKRLGRHRVMIVQLQGHLFFGNVASLVDAIKVTLNERRLKNDMPFIVIIDFTLVVGMDSSAAHAVNKMKRILHHIFAIEVTIFVSGSHRDSFPCEFALAEALCRDSATLDYNDIYAETREPGRAPRGSIAVRAAQRKLSARYPRFSSPRGSVAEEAACLTSHRCGGTP